MGDIKEAVDLMKRASSACEQALTRGFGPDLNITVIKGLIDGAIGSLEESGQPVNSPDLIRPDKSSDGTSAGEESVGLTEEVPSSAPPGEMQAGEDEALGKEVEKLSDDVKPEKKDEEKGESGGGNPQEDR